MEIKIASDDPKDSKLEAFFEHWVHGVGDEVSVLAPVEIQLSRGRTQTHGMATDAAGATLTLDLRERPLKVQLDPNYSVLATAN